MGDIKHYALNDQETGRSVVDVRMDKRTQRETDLLAFEIAIKTTQPAAVMCSYNLVNGDHACENDYLLNHVLKKDFGFKGWVLSDWDATHSTVKAANAGLDQEMPGDDFFGAPLKRAVAFGHGLSYTTFQYSNLKTDSVARTLQFQAGDYKIAVGTASDAAHLAGSVHLQSPEGDSIPVPAAGEMASRRAEW
jgi:beta-glucosidase-like glycosyl hydrolase